MLCIFIILFSPVSLEILDSVPGGRFLGALTRAILCLLSFYISYLCSSVMSSDFYRRSL